MSLCGPRGPALMWGSFSVPPGPARWPVPAALGTSALFLNPNLADSGCWSSIWEYLMGCGDGEQKARVHLPDEKEAAVHEKRPEFAKPCRMRREYCMSAVLSNGRF